MNEEVLFEEPFNSPSTSKGYLRKLAIIEATIECSASIGIEKTTYEAIAEKLGIRKSNIAYYFPEKSDIWLACVKYIIVTYRNISAKLVQESTSDIDALKGYISAPFHWAKEHPNQLTVMFIFYYLATQNSEYTKLHQSIRIEGRKNIFKLLKNIEGINTKTPRLKHLAQSIQSLISGALIDIANSDRKLFKEDVENAKSFLIMTVQSLINSTPGVENDQTFLLPN